MATTTPTVPAGVWICGECGDTNTIDLAPDVCPNPYCRHVRDYNGHCKNPGNQCADFDDIWTCNECGANNLDWSAPQCPICGAMRQNACSYLHGGNSFGGAGSPAAGTWTCGNCGCANSGWQDHCGSCQTAK